MERNVEFERLEEYWKVTAITLTFFSRKRRKIGEIRYCPRSNKHRFHEGVIQGTDTDLLQPIINKLTELDKKNSL